MNKSEFVKLNRLYRTSIRTLDVLKGNDWLPKALNSARIQAEYDRRYTYQVMKKVGYDPNPLPKITVKELIGPNTYVIIRREAKY